MKSKIKTKLLALAISPWLLASASANTTYQYSLQNAEEFESAFVDSLSLGNWTGVDGGPVLPTGSSFSINASTGLELTTETHEKTVAGYVWNYLLPLDSDWEVKVQARMADFTPIFMQDSLLKPFYYTGPSLFFVGNETSDPVKAFSNRLNWIFVRSLGENTPLENTLQESAYLCGYGSTGPVAVTPSEDVVLTLRYTSSNRTLTTSWRPLNGVDTEESTYEVDDWRADCNLPAYAALALTAAALPLGDEVVQHDPTQDYSLDPGLVYLKDLNITAASPDDLVLLSSKISTSSVSTPPLSGSPAVDKPKKKGKSSAKKSSGSKKKSEAKKSGGKKKSEGKRSGGNKKKKR